MHRGKSLELPWWGNSCWHPQGHAVIKKNKMWLRNIPFVWNSLNKKYFKSVVTKNSNTKVSDKMTYANSADPDQTAPEGAVWSGSTLFAVPLSILRNSCIKSKISARKVWNKVFEILGRLPYSYFPKLLDVGHFNSLTLSMLVKLSVENS